MDLGACLFSQPGRPRASPGEDPTSAAAPACGPSLLSFPLARPPNIHGGASGGLGGGAWTPGHLGLLPAPEQCCSQASTSFLGRREPSEDSLL